MSKKKSKPTCPTCGKALKSRWAMCPKCGKPNLARSRKAVVASLTKAAARPRGVTCVYGHWSAIPSRFCRICGGLIRGEMTPDLRLVKSDAGAEQFWRRELLSSPDPGQREMFYRHLYGKGDTA